MPDFSIVTKIEKKNKVIYLIKFQKNYLPSNQIYIKESDFVAWIFSDFSENERTDALGLLDKLRQSVIDADEFVFINKSTCERGRNIVSQIACIQKISQSILEDESILRNEDQ